MRLEVADLYYLAPELTLIIAAVVIALLDLVMPQKVGRSVLGYLSLAALAISAVYVAYLMVDINTGFARSVVLLDQSYRVDDFANLFKLVLLAGTALVITMSLYYYKPEDLRHAGEYYYLYLPAVVGGMIMASSGDLITLYVGLELLSITSYVLVGILKSDRFSNESAFKYLVQGAIASAFILYGMSFLYGLSGSTNIWDINRALDPFHPSYAPLIYVSFFLMIAGFGFKIAAVPFHAWASDVYRGAPLPVTGFVAVVSKGAAFAILFRILYNVYYGVSSSDYPIMQDVFLTMMVLAAASMIIGNALALRQRNMRRLLAYSGIANAGYLLVPIAIEFSPLQTSNFSELYYYLLAYVFMNLGIFAVLMAVSRAEGHDEMKAFAGLYHRAPWTAFATTVLVLSLAGLPVTGGFFGKFYILLSTVQGHDYWLAAVMIVTSVVSYYYYFSILRQVYMRPGTVGSVLPVGKPLGITIWICTLATLALGVFPKWILQGIDYIFDLNADFFIR